MSNAFSIPFASVFYHPPCHSLEAHANIGNFSWVDFWFCMNRDFGPKREWILSLLLFLALFLVWLYSLCVVFVVFIAFVVVVAVLMIVEVVVFVCCGCCGCFCFCFYCYMTSRSAAPKETLNK